MDWMGMKGLAATLVLEEDALHIYAAFAIQLAVAVITRKSLGHPLPWLAVFGFELINEFLDVILGEEAIVKPWQLWGAAHDLVNTMALPTTLLLLCRYRPSLFAAPV